MPRFFNSPKLDTAKKVAFWSSFHVAWTAAGTMGFTWLASNGFFKVTPGQKVYFVPSGYQYLNLQESQRAEKEFNEKSKQVVSP